MYSTEGDKVGKLLPCLSIANSRRLLSFPQVLPNFTMYPGILPHVAHMKPRVNQPSYFMPDDLKLVSGGIGLIEWRTILTDMLCGYM